MDMNGKYTLNNEIKHVNYHEAKDLVVFFQQVFIKNKNNKENKIMLVREFVNKYKNQEVKATDCIARRYIPCLEKSNIVSALVEVLSYENEGMITYDSINLNINKTIRMIKAYTNLEFENGYEGIDMLIESGLYRIVFEGELKEDVDVFNEMFKSQLDDLIRENNSMEAVLNRNLDWLVGSIVNVIEGLGDKVSGVDMGKISELINSGISGLNEVVSKTGK